ncbi:MAG: hypothetical protein ABIO36_06000 [Pyrinomonadaceae bacterium]
MSDPLRSVFFTLALICCIASSISLLGQETTGVAVLESEISLQRTKLTIVTSGTQESEQILRQIASLLNQCGEIRFSAGEYDLATKSFVEADVALKQYHTSAYARALADLADAEKRLADFEKDPNPETRPIRIKIGRSLVGSVLSLVYDEAQSLQDEVGERTALTRLGEVARADGDLSREAESYEKIGQLEFNAGNTATAFDLFAKAQDLRKKEGKKEYWSIDYIAGARWSLGEYDTAIELLRKRSS